MNTIALAIIFLNASQTFTLPPALLDSLCFVESGHNQAAVHLDDGGSNSVGVCQVKLRTARWLGFKGTEQQLLKPKTNVYYAAKYLAYQLHRYKNVEKAIVAYNKGNATNLLSSKYSVKVINQWAVTRDESKQVVSFRLPASTN